MTKAGNLLRALPLLLLAACASERVVLLPSADGRPSAVVLRDDAGERVLNTPYAGSVRRIGSGSAYQSSPAEVQQIFGQALAAQPPRPKSFMVYFLEGSTDTLTPASLAEFDTIKKEITSRPAAELTVIGHTDRVGKIDANDKLSLKRAVTVRDLLVTAGLPQDKIETAGRGERELLVPTEDEVAEAKNRRVEINVR